jgi:hypothetical protein
MDIWNIEPSYKGEKIVRGALGKDERHSSLPATQLSLMNLFDVVQECHNENLVVTVQRSRSAVLHVTIRMKKAGGPTPLRTRGAALKAG